METKIKMNTHQMAQYQCQDSFKDFVSIFSVIIMPTVKRRTHSQGSKPPHPIKWLFRLLDAGSIYDSCVSYSINVVFHLEIYSFLRSSDVVIRGRPKGFSTEETLYIDMRLLLGELCRTHIPRYISIMI